MERQTESIDLDPEIIELTELAQPKRPTFGEYLVRHEMLSREQLLCALQLKDRVPEARLGHCLVALGYMPRTAVEQLHTRFKIMHDAVLEQMNTNTFRREPEIEIIE